MLSGSFSSCPFLNHLPLLPPFSAFSSLLFFTTLLLSSSLSTSDEEAGERINDETCIWDMPASNLYRVMGHLAIS
jgi:hypothetical protein